MNQYRLIIFVLLALLLSSCASTSNTRNKFGHYHNYPYKPPAYVNESDEDECSWTANSKAQAAISELDDSELTTAGFFGVLGMSVGMARWNTIMNNAYEKAMKSCLQSKGYELPD
jgi:hypothetical protein